jgi:hypothetical protein
MKEYSVYIFDVPPLFSVIWHIANVIPLQGIINLAYYAKSQGTGAIDTIAK